MTPLLRPAVLCCLLTILALGACEGRSLLGLPAADDLRRAGPLRVPNPHAWGQAVDAGDPFTDGLEVLRLKGAPSATVTSVELVGDPGVSLTGAMLAGPGRGMGALQVIHSWPPRDRDLDESRLVPAVGATITDDSAGWELFVGMTAAEAATVDRLGINVGYDVAGVQHETFLPAFVRICVRQEAPGASEKCAPPADWLARQADRN